MPAQGAAAHGKEQSTEEMVAHLAALRAQLKAMSKKGPFVPDLEVRIDLAPSTEKQNGLKRSADEVDAETAHPTCSFEMESKRAQMLSYLIGVLRPVGPGPPFKSNPNPTEPHALAAKASPKPALTPDPASAPASASSTPAPEYGVLPSALARSITQFEQSLPVGSSEAAARSPASKPAAATLATSVPAPTQAAPTSSASADARSGELLRAKERQIQEMQARIALLEQRRAHTQAQAQAQSQPQPPARPLAQPQSLSQLQSGGDAATSADSEPSLPGEAPTPNGSPSAPSVGAGAGVSSPVSAPTSAVSVAVAPSAPPATASSPAH